MPSPMILFLPPFLKQGPALFLKVNKASFVSAKGLRCVKELLLFFRKVIYKMDPSQ